MAKDLDLYSYSFIYGKDVIKDIHLVSTYENMGCTFTKLGAGEATTDLSTVLEPNESTTLIGSPSNDKEVTFTLTIMNHTKEAKPYRDCSIVRGTISGKNSIILPKGIYYGMEEKELVKELGEPDSISETDLVYIYNYYQYPYKETQNSKYSATGNGYSFTILKSSKIVDTFTCNMGFKPSEGLTEYSGFLDRNGKKAIFTTKLEIPNSYNGFDEVHALDTVISINNIPYIVHLSSNFYIARASEIPKPLDYSFLFEKACDPIDPIEFVPEYLKHDGTSGYSYGFRDKGDKYTSIMNFANNQGFIGSDSSYIMPLNPDDKITEEAKQAFKDIVKAFSTNLQFEIL